MSVQGDAVIGALEVRPHARLALVDGHVVPLTQREFDIVMTLAEHPGWVYSANQLAGDLEQGEHSPESVSVLVSRLRRRFAAVGLPDAIETVRGSGYRLSAAAETRGETSGTAVFSRELRDASWRLQEAVIEVEHSGTREQQADAAETLEKARHDIFAALAE